MEMCIDGLCTVGRLSSTLRTLGIILCTGEYDTKCRNILIGSFCDNKTKTCKCSANETQIANMCALKKEFWAIGEFAMGSEPNILS